jgi:CelD/BcsL family acetyltransferase involved in cellulose biosynthesis
LLQQTAGASFFQSLEWLEAYWRHFGAGQRLRVMLVRDADRLLGILPLVVRSETTRVGRLRTLTFPLHDWGSFYGPIGPQPGLTLAAGLEHIRRTRRDWDVFELRWQGAPGTDPMLAPQTMLAAGFQAYPTVWDYAAMVDLVGTWQSYWSARKGAWLRRFRHAQHKLAEQGTVSYVRYRPLGLAHGDGSSRWDLYDACEELARRSWQGAATNGTTLSHEPVRDFLRESHEAAAACGAVDLNLLLLDGTPAAFVYGYHYRGYLYGLRRGFDAQRTREGAGNVLLAHVLEDGFARGDRIYDMGVGSLASKRYFQTRLAPILRYSHFPVLALRAQALRVRRWWQARRLPASTAVGRVQDGTADAR